MAAAAAIRVGIIDSGLSRDRDAPVAATRDFCAAEGGASEATDRLGHGTAVASALLEQCPGARLFVARVFDTARTGGLARVVEAIDWLIGQEVTLINASLGAPAPSAELREACRRATGAGIVIVASTAARGAVSYPAAYPECVAACGDARCAPGEVSWLGSEMAEFGAHPFAPASNGRQGGASFAAARVTGHFARLLSEGVPADALREALKARCLYRGRERRRA